MILNILTVKTCNLGVWKNKKPHGIPPVLLHNLSIDYGFIFCTVGRIQYVVKYLNEPVAIEKLSSFCHF